jgi:AhpC/TSA family
MQKLFVALVLALMFVAPFSRAADKEQSSAMPKVGDPAPDFKLQYFDGHGLKDVTLDQYKGKKQVVLAFYVFAFTGG